MATFPKGPVAFKGCVHTQNGNTLTERAADMTLVFGPDDIENYKRREEPGGDFFRSEARNSRNTLSYLLLERMVYFTSVEGPLVNEHFDLLWVCSLDGEAAVRSRDGNWHKEQIRAYNARRAATAQIPVDGGDGFSPQMSEDYKALIKKFRTMQSFTMRANAQNPGDSPWVKITATFPDGSKDSIDVNHDMFDQIIAVSTISGTTGALVTATARHDESMQQAVEVKFGFGGDRSFRCYGQRGKTGVDTGGPHGAMLYTGQPGSKGPDITVEVAAADVPDVNGEQVLKYRLTCGDKVEHATASASSPIYVETVGGNGGHGVPLPKGDGTNGGDGGDGGDILIVVDPSVRKHNVKGVSTPGKGGAASDKSKTNRFSYGTPGADGKPGTIETQTKRVSL